MTLRLRAAAYTLDAIIDAGIAPDVARTLLAAAGPHAVPERPLMRVGGRKRDELTTHYVWGPDAMVLLEELDETGAPS